MLSTRIAVLAPLWILLSVLPACLVLGGDGGWSEWTEWDSCPVTCGRGTRIRLRFCNNPAPTNGGQWCKGKPRQFMKCEAPIKCPVDGGWSEWTPWTGCSVSCGQGIRQRTRECDSPAPANGGVSCEGSSQDIMECTDVKECPRDGHWSKWSLWSACSVTCGDDGRTSRYRSCNNPKPAAGGKDCVGRPQQTKRCNAPRKCPVNGQWSEWTEWTPCSVTCGSGARARWRMCDNPPPQNGGLDCKRDEAGEMQERSCNGSVVYCKVNGGWSEWSEWGDCHAPNCKSPERAFWFKHRTCSSPYPSHNGSMCQGEFLNATWCDDPINCPVNGEWSEWSKWDCDQFIATRSRKCDNPPPSNGGKPCKGNEKDTITLDDDDFRKACPLKPIHEGSGHGDDEDLGGSGSGVRPDDEDD